jgi:hypothetical protein
MRIRFLALAAAFSGLLLAGCSRRESPVPEAPPAAPPLESAASAQPAVSATREAQPATVSAAPATTAPAPSPALKSAQRTFVSPGKTPAAAAKPPSSSKPEPAPQPATESRPAPAAPAALSPISAAAQASASKVEDPGGAVAVASTSPGATRIGAEKCKLCHKLQYASWAENAHAKRTPPLDCESCHGPGSEYKTLSVMKDLAKAKAAGLVIPDASFCATCHKRDWKSDMLAKTHAHKAK